MNVRLRKTLGWYNALIYKDRFIINHSSVEINMLTVTKDNQEQNIAYERMKYWVQNIMTDSILISHDNPSLAAYQATDARVIVLPDEPVDQIVGIMLYLKLNAIMENRIVVTDTEIWSAEGDSMSYLHSHGEDLGSSLGIDGWWTDPRPTWFTTQNREESKIVTLDRSPEWSDYGLGWEDVTAHDSNVVFAKFGQDENQ